MPEKEFKVSNLITLELENATENITLLINGELDFSLHLYLKMTDSEKDMFITYGDNAGEYTPKYSDFLNRVSQRQEFWVYCSNIQAWVENNYDTSLLDYCCAFPILRKLVELGDTNAQKAYKKEILKGLTSTHEKLISFLLEKEYFNYLDDEEKKRVLLTIFEKNSFNFIFRSVLDLRTRYPSKPFDRFMPKHVKRVLNFIPKKDVLISLFKNLDFWETPGHINSYSLINALDYWINQDKIEDTINKASEKREKYTRKFLERDRKEPLTKEERKREIRFLTELKISTSRSESFAKIESQMYKDTDRGKYLISLFESLGKKSLLNLFGIQATKEIFEFDYNFYGFSVPISERDAFIMDEVDKRLRRLSMLYSFLIKYVDKDKLEQFLHEKNSIAMKKLISFYNNSISVYKKSIMGILVKFFASVDDKYFRQYYPEIQKKNGQIEVSVKAGKRKISLYFTCIEDFYEEFDIRRKEDYNRRKIDWSKYS